MAEHRQAELFQQRLHEIAGYYRHGDVVLGYRRLLDLALDTNSPDIYDATCAHTDWLENRQPDETENRAAAMPLLEKIGLAGPFIRKQSGEEILNTTEIRKRYTNGLFSLGPISLSLKRGEMLGLVGENGNGKTTLLRILAGALDHNGGSITYSLPQNNKRYELRSQLAYIPQRTPEWYGPLKDNLKFTLSSYGIKGRENESLVLMMIARMGLWSYRQLDWKQLSSGYKMRFELARTLLRRPDILLLDEPLANLDVLAQQTILEDLKSLANSLSSPMAVVLSSQQLYEVEKVSDKVLFLKNGQALWQHNGINGNEADPSAEQQTGLVVELETENGREALEAALNGLPLSKISFNGGTYILCFDLPATMPLILAALGNAGIKIVYIRDISRSTRRFFVNR